MSQHRPELHLTWGEMGPTTLRNAGVPANEILVDHAMLGDGAFPITSDPVAFARERDAHWGIRNARPGAYLLHHRGRLRRAARVTIWAGTWAADQLFAVWAAHVLDVAGVDPARVRLTVPAPGGPDIGCLIAAEDVHGLHAVPLDEGKLAHLRAAWDAVVAPAPDLLLALLADARPDGLSALQVVLARFLDRFPDPASGLSRWDRAILEVVDARGPSRRDVIGELLRASDPTDLVTDHWIEDRALRLASPRLHAPLLEATGGRWWQSHNSTFTLTDAGRVVLAGRADAIALNGVDDAVLNVRLTTARHWVRTADGLAPRSGSEPT